MLETSLHPNSQCLLFPVAAVLFQILPSTKKSEGMITFEDKIYGRWIGMQDSMVAIASIVRTVAISEHTSQSIVSLNGCFFVLFFSF